MCATTLGSRWIRSNGWLLVVAKITEVVTINGGIDNLALSIRVYVNPPSSVMLGVLRVLGRFVNHGPCRGGGALVIE